MTRVAFVLALVCGFIAGSCSEEPAGSAPDGGPGNAPPFDFVVADQYEYPFDTEGSGYDLSRVFVRMFETADPACFAFVPGRRRVGTRMVEIVAGYAGRDEDVTAGAHAIGGEPFQDGGVRIYYTRYAADGGGNREEAMESVSGTVTFDRLDLARATGSFSVVMAPKGKPGAGVPFAGTFDAPVCLK